MKLFKRSGVRFGVLIALQLGVLFSVALLRSAGLLFRTTEVFFWKVLFQRGLPLVFAFDAAALVSSFFITKDTFKTALTRHKASLLWTAAVFSALALIAVWVGKTRTGLEKENAFYGKPTVPLLEWHLLAAFFFCLLALLIQRSGKMPRLLEKLLPLILWSFTFLVWISIPNQNGFFSPAGRAPNYETYPFSDGSFYGHYARSVAAGMGLKGNDIPPRPLYIALLGFFHLIGDNQYDRIIFIQTLLLAWLPPVIYLIGKELGHPCGGLAGALLALLRETHSILVAPFGHNVSTTKYFFSDLPTALCGAFVLLAVLRLLNGAERSEKSVPVHALFVGCGLGAMTLIRTQSLCLIIPILAWLLFRKRSLWRSLLWIGLALGACLAPWLIRNQRITGSFVFDHPMTQTAEMARSYNFDGLDLERKVGENDGAYTERLSLSIKESVRKHKTEIGRFILVHFINGEICNLRLFPLRNSLRDPAELIKTQTPFWEESDSGELDTYNIVFFGMGALLLLFGIASVRKEVGGSLPIVCNVIFNLSTAVGRYSGGRYLIPLDWVIMLYIGLGFEALIRFDMECCGLSLPAFKKKSAFTCGRIWMPCVCVLLIAGTIPAAEHLIPQHFFPESAESVKEALGNPSLPCKEADKIFLNAIAVYPRYYAPGEGEPESAKQGYAVTDHGRLIFLTLAPNAFGTFEMATETPPEFFPDGAEIRVAACQAGATSLVEKLEIVRNETQ